MRSSLTLQLGSVVLMTVAAGAPPPNYVLRTVYNPDLYPNTFSLLHEAPFTNNETVYDTNTSSFIDGTVFFLNTSYNVQFATTNSIAVSSAFTVQSYQLFDSYFATHNNPDTFQTVYSTSSVPATGRRLYRNSSLTLPVSANSQTFVHDYGIVATSSTGAITSVPSAALLTPCYITHAETATSRNVYTADLINSSEVSSCYVFYNSALTLPVTADFSHNQTYFAVNTLSGLVTARHFGAPVSNRIGFYYVDTGVLVDLAFSTPDNMLAVGVYVYTYAPYTYTPIASRSFREALIATVAYLTNNDGQIEVVLFENRLATINCASAEVAILWATVNDGASLPTTGVYNSTATAPFSGQVAIGGSLRTYVNGEMTDSVQCPT